MKEYVQLYAVNGSSLSLPSSFVGVKLRTRMWANVLAAGHEFVHVCGVTQ